MSDRRLFNLPFATIFLVVFGAMDLLWLRRYEWQQAIWDVLIATAGGFTWESLKD